MADDLSNSESDMEDIVVDDDYEMGCFPSTSGHQNATNPEDSVMELEHATPDVEADYATDEDELWKLCDVDNRRGDDGDDDGIQFVSQVGSGQANPTANVRLLYTAKLLTETTALKGSIREHVYQLTLAPGAADKIVDISEMYSLVLKDLVSAHTAKLGEPNGFYVGLKINYAREVLQRNKELVDQTFGVAFKPVHSFDIASLKREIALRAQSGKKVNMFTPESKLEVAIATMKYASGSGRVRKPVEKMLNRHAVDPSIRKKSHHVKDSSKSRTNITPNKVTELCLGVAILQAKAWNLYQRFEKGTVEWQVAKAQWRKISEISPDRPERAVMDAARQLLRRAGIYKDRQFTIQEDVESLQRVLYKYNIVIMGDDGHTSPLFVGCRNPDREVLALMLKDGHYQHIKSLPAFMYSNFYCMVCNVRGKNRRTHYKCPLLCRRCMCEVCPYDWFKDVDMDAKCPDCGIRFLNSVCFKSHKQQNGPLGGKSLCETTKICPKCSDSYYTANGDKHVCGKKYCMRCKTAREEGHDCYMSIKEAPRNPSWGRIFFDLETEIVERDGVQFHEVIAAVAIKSCADCMETRPNSFEEAIASKCDSCCEGKERLKIFERVTEPNRENDVMKSFCTWLFHKSHANYTVVAHNLKGYDGQFLLREMIQASQIHDPDLILCNGTKILGIIMSNQMRIIDSYSFVPFGLGKFGKAFNVEESEIAKGHFPYGMLRKEFFDYDGEFPSIDLFGIESMTVERAAEVKKYHEKMTSEEARFNFASELVRYCVSDVLVLNAGMAKFEKKFHELTDVILLQECITAAGGAIKTFRRKFLEEDSIALDSHPVEESMKQSVEASRYLHYRSELEGLPIRTKWSGGEYSLEYGTKKKKIFCDGYIEPCEKYPKGLVIEYKGSYWHAAPDLYSPKDAMFGNQTAADIWARDARREAVIQQHHDLDVVWSHKVETERRTNPRLDELMSHNHYYGECLIQDSLKGGRTEAKELLRICGLDEQIWHLDFVSLYPTSQKYGEFPYGPGTRIRGQDITVPITCPEQLENIRNSFGRGRVSSQSANTECTFKDQQCTHEGEERWLRGSWTTPELELALKKGYIIRKVYGAVHYENRSSYNHSRDFTQHNIFSKYVNCFIKEKMESSGWPADCVTDEQKARFVVETLELDGVLLNPDLIRNDPVGRQVAKLLLNSLWGKLAEAPGRPQTMLISDVNKFYALLRNSRYEVVPGYILSEKKVLVTVKTVTDAITPLETNSTHLASFTTSLARIRLYEAMDRLDPDTFLYCDTDSLMFVGKKGQPTPLDDLMGSRLTCLTDEVKPGYYIKSFVCTGPKCYAYELRSHTDPDYVKYTVKSKGFARTKDAEHKITYDAMKKMVEAVVAGKEPVPVEVEYSNIVRDKYHRISTTPQVKKFSYTFKKRRLIDGGKTVPIGYKD